MVPLLCATWHDLVFDTMGIRNDGARPPGPETREIGTQTEIHLQLSGIDRPINRYLSLSTTWVPRWSSRTDQKGRDAWTDQSKRWKSKGVYMGTQFDVRPSKTWNTMETRSTHDNARKKNAKDKMHGNSLKLCSMTRGFTPGKWSRAKTKPTPVAADVTPTAPGQKTGGTTKIYP